MVSTPIAASALQDPTRIHPFTNFQWYLTAGRNTVYFAAFSPVRITEEAFLVFVGQLLSLAPQLNLRSDERHQVHIDMSPVPAEAVGMYRMVESLDEYPDKVAGPNSDLFDDPERPAFRAECYVLSKGQAKDGNRSFVLMRAPHALMEGVDTSRLMRGLPAGHPPPIPPIRAPLRRIAAFGLGILFVPLNYVVTGLLNRNREEWGIGTLTLDRSELKRAAASLGVQQRSLIFALVMRGYYDPGARRRTLGYTNLPSRRNEGDDAYVRLQMRTTRMQHDLEFEPYVRQLDRQLANEKGGSSWTQLQNDAFFSVHRRIARLLPFLYRRRFFGYVPYDFLLSLVPPHLSGTGLFEHFGFNDVYCGSHTPGVNCCVIVPQRDRVSLNIYCPVRDLPRTSDIEALARAMGVSILSAREGTDNKALSASDA